MGWPGECRAHPGAACVLLLHLVAGCIAAPSPATILHSLAVSTTTTQPPTATATEFPPPNSTAISPELLASPPSPPSPRRFQRSVKEQDLVDYIAIQELGEQQRYVSSSDGGGAGAGDYLGWPPADRLGWQLQPQVGKRPKRMRGQEGAAHSRF
jgi:hypothetical protein